MEFGGILLDANDYSRRISNQIWESPISPALKSRPVEDVELVEYVPADDIPCFAYPIKQMGKHPGSISSSRSITSTVDPLKMEWISRISFLQILNSELLAASITIVAVGVSNIFPTVVSISAKGTAMLLEIGTLHAGREHKCGPPALCPDSKTTSASISVDRAVYNEEDALW